MSGTGATPDRVNAAQELLRRAADCGPPDRPLFRFLDRTVTVGRFTDMVHRYANALLSLGLEIEQRVALLVPDSPDLAAAFLGTVRMGGIAIPVNPLLPPADLAHILADSRARALVVHERLLPAAQPLLPACPHLRHVLLVQHGPPQEGGTGPLGQHGPPRHPERPDALPAASEAQASRGGSEGPQLASALLAAASAAPPAVDTSAGDAAFWCYTSGSTGRPKGVIKSHFSLLHKADHAFDDTPMRPDDVLYSAAKLFVDLGIHNLVATLANGICQVLDPERPSPERVLHLLRTHRPAIFMGMPTLLARLMELPGVTREDFASLRVCKVGAEPLPPALYHRFLARFGIEPLEMMGTTETGGVLITSRRGKVHPGWLGQANTGIDVKIVDADGNALPDGQTGRLMVKDPAMASGYWNRPAETRRTFIGEWVVTGDLFERDRDGYLRFAGRVDDVIDVGGRKVIPGEVEAAILAHPQVADCGVVGLPDADGLVVPVAFVVLKPGIAGTPELAADLQALVKSALAPYSYPRVVRFVERLPRNALGKLERYKLKEL